MTVPRAAGCVVFTEAQLLLFRFGGIKPPESEITLTRDDNVDLAATMNTPLSLQNLIGYILKPHGPAHEVNITIGTSRDCWIAVRPVPYTRSMAEGGLPIWWPILRIINVWRLVISQDELRWEEIQRQIDAIGVDNTAQVLNERLASEALRAVNGIFLLQGD